MAALDFTRAQIITDAIATWAAKTGGAAPQPTADRCAVRVVGENRWEVDLGDASGVFGRASCYFGEPESGYRAPVITVRAVPRLLD